MKNTLLIFSLLISVMGYSQSTENAGEYMAYFSDEFKIMQKDMWDYTSSVSHGKSARTVEKRRFELVKTSDASLAKVKKAKDFDGDSDYKDAVVNYFQIINIVLKEDYAEIVDMEAISEQSYDAMEAYMMARDQANDKQAEASEALTAAQRKFAEENDVTLVEASDALNDKMKVAGEVFDHYNEVYLIFFKSNKQEIYMMDAIESRDLSAIEQNRDALTATVEEGFEKLKDVVAYEGDKTMMTATEEIFAFYAQEVKDVKIILNYFLKTENFKKIKEAFDQKKEKDRTQEDVDQFNNGVNEMNAAITEYNEMTERNNEQRSNLIDGWNKAADKFTNKHVPKGK